MPHNHDQSEAREYGLPVLANVKDATKILTDGGRVRLDTTNRIVDANKPKEGRP